MMDKWVIAASQKELEHIDQNIQTKVLGVGLFHFSLALHSFLLTHSEKIESIYLVGIAGGTKDHKLGETVIIENDIIGDAGAFENNTFNNLEDLALQPKNISKSNFNLAHKFKEAGIPSQSISVHSIHEDEQINTLRLTKQNASIENMEGAAFHHLCEQFQVPYLHIRGVSNHIGERDKSLWKINEAILNYSQKINNLLSE